MVNRYNNGRTGMQRDNCSYNTACNRPARVNNCTGSSACGDRNNGFSNRSDDRCDHGHDHDHDHDCNRSHGDCKNIMERLRKIDFAIVDTVLYLDSYPDCHKAREFYDKLICERRGLREELAKKCRRPMTAFENEGDAWDWIGSPWPWDPSAN